MKTDIRNSASDGFTSENDNFNNLNSLVIRLRKEDDRFAKKMKNMKWLYIVMIIIYTGLMVINPDPELKLHNRISGFCYVSAFIIFAVLFKQKIWDFSTVDYSMSSSEMLTRAAHRYRFSFSQFFFVLPSILLIDAGFSISLFYRLTSLSPLNRILILQAFYIPLILISGFIGYLIWRRKLKPLYESAKELLNELKE